MNSLIVERMIKCNHPQFGKDNKAQLENLFAFLLQHIHDCASIGKFLIEYVKGPLFDPHLSVPG